MKYPPLTDEEREQMREREQQRDRKRAKYVERVRTLSSPGTEAAGRPTLQGELGYDPFDCDEPENTA